MTQWIAEPEGEGALKEALDVAAGLMALGVVIVATLLISWAVKRVALRLGRRQAHIGIVVNRLLKPVTALIFLGGMSIASFMLLDSDKWLGRSRHAITIGLIAVSAWLVTSIVKSIEDIAVSRVVAHAGGEKKGRRARTHMSVLRWMINMVVWVLASAGILLTFPAARAAGAGFLASAGLVSVVIGIAAQSTLGNVFAGIQLAFSGAVRVDDIVLINGQGGRIEEITMTYVVLRCWDDRRVIFPSTFLTTNPFENWSRSESGLTGHVDLQLGWQAPVEEMRGALLAILEDCPEWDGRTGSLIITDAINGFVNVRATVTATTMADLGKVRIAVREGLVNWLQEHAPQAMPQPRLTQTPPQG